MGLRHEVELAAGHVRIIGTGRLTMPEMIAAVDAVAEDPRFCSHFTVTFDIREGDYTAEMDDGDMFVAALKRREADFQNRNALVVPPSLRVLGRLFCLLAQVSGLDRFQSFTDMAEARAWCARAP